MLVIVLARAGVDAPARLLAPLNAFVASLVQGLVRLGGIPAERHAALLYVPGTFAYEIVAGCTGLLPATVVAVAILAAPGTRAARSRGMVLGVGVLLLINVLRLAHLFYLGVRAPQQFPAAHLYVWEAVLVAATGVVWLAFTPSARAVR